jgi:hypothetical protein
VIVGDNVAEYYYCGTDQEDFDIKTDFPCQVPPFNQFWVEWSQPTAIRSRVHRDVPVEMSAFPFCGCLVTMTTADAAMPDEWLGVQGYATLAWVAFAYRTAGIRSAAVHAPGADDHHLPESEERYDHACRPVCA